MKWKESSPAGGHQQATLEMNRASSFFGSLGKVTRSRQRRLRILQVVSALGLVLSIVAFALISPVTTARAQGTPQRGVMIHNLNGDEEVPVCHSTGGMSKAETIDAIVDNDVEAIRVQLPDLNCTWPEDIAQMLYDGTSPDGVRTVIMQIAQHISDLDENTIVQLFNQDVGNSQMSYSDLYDEYNGTVDFVLQFGNEPDYFFDAGSPGVPAPASEGWSYRWYALNAYKRLANNACGDVPQAWNQRYPNMEWALALPAENYDYMLNSFEWIGHSEDSPGCNDQLDAGSVVDYYDIMTPHLYGGVGIPDGATVGWQIWEHVRSSGNYDVILTEMGIHGGTFPSKCQTYRNDVIAEIDPYYNDGVRANLWFYVGNWNNPDGPNYELADETSLAACGGGF